MNDECPIPLDDGPWMLSGSNMPADIRQVEVDTVSELMFELSKLLELSPTSEVIVSKRHDT